VNIELGKFYSRYGDIRILLQTGEQTFLVRGKSRYCRCSQDPEGKQITMFDFEGGPTYYLDQPFPFDDSKNKISVIRPSESAEGESAVEITVIPTKTRAKKPRKKSDVKG